MQPANHFTVVGAGNGGKSMAAHLGLLGASVKLFNRTYANIAAIAKRGGIELDSNEGGPSGFGKLALVTSDMAEALEGSEVIMVATPSSAHAELAKIMAPFLTDGQIVVLNPGRTCGAIEFRHVLNQMDCTTQITVAETETFIYACRAEGPAQAFIFRIKDAIPLAALPSKDNQKVIDALSGVYPQFIDGADVLHTGLNNMGAIFHPTLTLLNAARIESTRGNFEFYYEGVTSSVADVLEAIDRERVTEASALGILARTAMEWLQIAYNVRGKDLNEAIHNQTGYQGIKAPATLNHRYIFEDVPMSLVPIASLGKQYGVSVRGMDAIIRLACIIHKTDYWRRGRTLEKLGLCNLSVGEIQHYVKEGTLQEY